MSPQLTNSALVELLALEAGRHEARSNKEVALRRAARAALGWDTEAAEVVAAGGDLTSLWRVGPYVASVIEPWLENPPEVPDPDPLRAGFLTMSEVRRIIASGDGRQPLADLQMHTTYSDGHGTVEEMAARAGELGYTHICLTEHTKGLKIARGMDEEGFAKQAEHLRRVNSENAAPVVLQSVEMNLSPTGEGDMDLDFLARLPVVLGAFHSKLRITEDQTDRYIAALNHPQLCILAHPRGRIFNHRLGLRADWERVIAEAVRLDRALEVDAYPDRQDLDVETLRIAAEAGARISIGSDAHHPVDLDFLPYGVAATIAAGVRPDRILNLMPRDDLIEWAASVRSGPRMSSPV
jgi:histidinol phosphatase-like PHP family hydrolase